jgi:hypothetical protein
MNSEQKARQRRAIIDRPLAKLTDDELAGLMALGKHARLFTDGVGKVVEDLAELAVGEDSAREYARETAPPAP